MAALILHHFGLSPFAEKVSMVLGAKGLQWQSVTVPMVMPEPDVVGLTGGYRRTPFLQIGADIYCDTALVCKVLDGLAPQPALYPQAVRGLADSVAQWADTALFWVAIPFTSQPASYPHLFPGKPLDLVRALYADRAAMAPNLRRPALADASAQLHAYLERVENMLADERLFLLGGQPCIADFSVAQSIWYMRHSPPVAVMLDAFAMIQGWHARMRALGHGTPVEIGSADAIAIAAGTAAHAPARVDPGIGHSALASVTVTPTDYALDPVAGRLVGLTREEVVLERVDPRAGRVHVHFPRVGFQVAAATGG